MPGPEVAWDEFVIVSAKISGGNCIALIADDQPCLAQEVISLEDRFCWLIRTATFSTKR